MPCRSRAWRALLIGAMLALVPARHAVAHADEQVDVALALAVDVSLSMSPQELEIQRHGYAAALLDKSVLDAIAQGANGRIAVAYFEWAGSSSQRLVVPWTVIASRGDAERAAAMLTAAPSNSARRTSISSAIDFAAALLDRLPVKTAKRVIDISGDGPNNQGAAVTSARDAAVGKGIVVNGLPLMTGGGFGSAFDIPRLDLYYADCVIGGPGSFVVPVNGWEQFPEAVRRKLVLELADAASVPLERPWLLRVQERPRSDCLIGEKRWRDRGWTGFPQ